MEEVEVTGLDEYVCPQCHMLLFDFVVEGEREDGLVVFLCSCLNHQCPLDTFRLFLTKEMAEVVTDNDDDAGPGISAEAADKALNAPFREVLEGLQDALGPENTTRICGISKDELLLWLIGNRPNESQQDRVRAGYYVMYLVRKVLGGDESVRAWFTEPNVHLGGKSPAQVLGEDTDGDTADQAESRVFAAARLLAGKLGQAGEGS